MKANVLIVEDERHLADGLRFNLEAEGYAVEIIADGETALVRLTRQRRVSSRRARRDDARQNGFEVAAGSDVRVSSSRPCSGARRPEDVLSGFEAARRYSQAFQLSILLARLSGLLRAANGCITIEAKRRRRRKTARETGAATRLRRDDGSFASRGELFDLRETMTSTAGTRGGKRTVGLTLMERIAASSLAGGEPSRAIL